MTIKDLKEFIKKNELSDNTEITVCVDEDTVFTKSFAIDETPTVDNLVIIGYNHFYD